MNWLKQYFRWGLLSFLLCFGQAIATAQAPVLQTITANDPNDGDSFFSLADELILVFDIATNQTAVATKAQIDAIFVFSQSLGTNYTGTWSSATTLIISITDPFNHASPTIGATTVDLLAASALMDASSTFSAAAGTYGPIFGDWGLGSPAPFIGGSDDGYDYAEFVDSDTCVSEGGQGSGYAMDELLSPFACGFFFGDSTAGYASADTTIPCFNYQGDSTSGYSNGGLASTQNCLFFKGETASGYRFGDLDNPYACPQFLASAAGADGFAARSLSEDQGGCIDLPIEASPLQGELLGRDGRLFWETYTELDNEGFEILKSLDGMDWESIGWVAGKGNSTARVDYEFWDYGLNSELQYYRFRQFDLDGSNFLSNIVALRLDEEQKPLNFFTVFPNPVVRGNSLKIESWFDKDLSTKIMIYNMLGQQAHSLNHRFTQSENRLEIPIYELASGSYVLEMIGDNGAFRETIQFIVID